MINAVYRKAGFNRMLRTPTVNDGVRGPEGGSGRPGGADRQLYAAASQLSLIII